jgi:hypothetical protein
MQQQKVVKSDLFWPTCMKYLLFTIFAFARIVALVTGQLMARGTVIQLPLLSSIICCVCCNKCIERPLKEDET